MEARWIASLLPVFYADLRRPWSPEVTISDASLSGYAVGARALATPYVAALGRQPEGLRFRAVQPRPRETALGPMDPLSDLESVRVQRAPVVEDRYEVNGEFVEVSSAALEAKDWKTHFAKRMYDPETIGTLEGRGIVASARQEVRSRRCFHMRNAHLSDNMSLVLGLTKGRSSAYRLLLFCRRLGAISIAANASFLLRWVPSERNVVDGASRIWERERKWLATQAARANQERSNDVPYAGSLTELRHELKAEPFPVEAELFGVEALAGRAPLGLDRVHPSGLSE